MTKVGQLTPEALQGLKSPRDITVALTVLTGLPLYQTPRRIGDTAFQIPSELIPFAGVGTVLRGERDTYYILNATAGPGLYRAWVYYTA